MGAAFDTLLEKVKGEVPSVSVDAARARLNNGANPLLIDVREREAFAEGYIPGAENIPRGFLELQIEGVSNDRSRAILLYGDDSQSALATRDLVNMGYKNVAYIDGGLGAWKDAGYETAKDRPLTKAETFRYARHLIVPEVGERGQGKLLDARVLLIGAGGLGSPAAYYLAAAGVGTVGIVDADVVDVSNLQRQILHGTSDVGRPKVVSAYEKLKDMNPACNVVPHQIYLTSDNVMEVIEIGDGIL